MNAQDIIFTVGMEGSFELIAPFANAVRAGSRYTVSEVRSMSAIIKNNEDPRALYNKFGVDEASYVRDLQLDMSIIGLQADTGELVHVPQSYIASYPNVSGVSYRPLGLVVPLGVIPDNLDLANLIATIQVAVVNQLGINTEVSVASVGASELYTQDEHQRITNARKALVTTNESPAAITVRLQRENQVLRDENKILSDALKAAI